ncbi:hypothetical protein AVEN_109341-1 [Araneus ventricosus]|uniref:Uncharacterized protein n=1 Tax=Araneus ventricosus TaxID=182803 RepID=A0A4Y2D345_ARAVE|nr:hypothetical protein AVEN_109341-1 [Araneus ventricosus]
MQANLTTMVLCRNQVSNRELFDSEFKTLPPGIRVHKICARKSLEAAFEKFKQTVLTIKSLVGAIKGEKEWKRRLQRNSLIDHKGKALFKAHHRKLEGGFDGNFIAALLRNKYSLLARQSVITDVSSVRVIFSSFRGGQVKRLSIDMVWQFGEGDANTSVILII